MKAAQQPNILREDKLSAEISAKSQEPKKMLYIFRN